MIEVDRVMIEDLHIELIQMMENAGRNLARLVLDRAAPDRVVVVAGSGGNGGGGLVAARHLTNAGVEAVVVTSRPASELSPVPAHQFDILIRMGVAHVERLPPADVIVDAVIGYSLRGEPRGRSADLIEQINGLTSGSGSGDGPTVVALDNPSGLNVTTGQAPGVVVSADATLTLCLPKLGLRAAPQVGDLYLADISVPPSVTGPFGQEAGAEPPDFRSSSILAVSR